MTLTVKVQVLRLVQLSVAVQVTLVVPRGNSAPGGGEHVTVTLVSALSMAGGSGNETEVVDAVPQSKATRLVGHWMTGGMVSCAIVMVKLHTADSRQALVARHVTVVGPRMKALPEAGVQVRVAFVGQLPEIADAG